jgi:diguanylate cyclase (GGDEF)-like protein
VDLGPAGRWLAAWLVAVLLADLVAQVAIGRARDLGAGRTGLLYAAAHAVLLLAALDPAAGRPPVAHPGDGGQPAPPVPLRMAVLWLAGLAAPAALLVHAWKRTEPDIAFVALVVAGTLSLVLVRLLHLLRDVQSQADELQLLSGTDMLTGLANRRAWEGSFAAVCRRAAAAGEPVAVLMIDLDHFKAYNDQRGHLAGDRLLQDAVRVWRSVLRPGDLLARWGGEEFAACLPGCDADEALAVAQRLLDGMPQGQTMSVGVAVLADGELPGALLARADGALYTAKREGRAQVAAAPPP